MLVLKRLVTILVMVYVLLALLLIVSPGSRDGLMSVTAGANETGFYYTLFIIGAVLLLLQLITENIDSVLLRREVTAREGKINELKARLYDHQMDQRDREIQQRAAMANTNPVVAANPPVTTPSEPVRTVPPGPPTNAPHANPVFPQSAPGLTNAPLDKPNHIIPPAGPDHRPQ